MSSFNKSILALIAVLALSCLEAHADSFTITNTGGTAYLTTSMDGGPPTLVRPLDFYLAGPGLSVSAFSEMAWGGDTGNVEARDTCRVMLCTSGTVLGTNSTFSGILRRSATATVNGVQFWPVTLSGSLNFFSDPIVFPNSISDYTVTIPFIFSGEINGDRSGPLFTSTLTGRGLATFRFWNTNWDFSIPPHFLLYSIDYRFEPVRVQIDIKPGTFPNDINPRSRGRIAVAILTTSLFDATSVDPTTVRFGGSGIETAPVQFATEDVDGDGDIDLVFHFPTQDAGIACGTTSAWLTGAVFGGPTIKGPDSINTVGCN
jgi:hypothetical protein